MKETMVQYIEKHHLISYGDKIVAGVSGGADSVCLLHLLNECRERWNLSLVVVHVKHGIRGEEADEDAVFVEKMAARFSLPFFSPEGDVPALAAEWGMSEEEAGRKFRYEQMEKIRKEQKADAIAVAHHRDDQAETVLFRLFRGSGVRGLSGMLPRKGRIIRPLLFAGRREIEDFLRQQGYVWREDSTNCDMAYSRNRIRKELLPRIEETINARAGQHIADTAGDVAAWRGYIEKMAGQAAEEILENINGEITLKTDSYCRQDEVIQKEILRLFLEKALPGVRDVSRIHYNKLHELISQETGKELDLPGGVKAVRDYDRVRLRIHDDCVREPVRIECPVPSVHIVKMEHEFYRITLAVKKREELERKIPQKDYTKWFDYDKIKSGLVLRNPEKEDYFVLDSEGHRKRLSRYYRDRKVAAQERKRQFVLADGAHVIWAFPDRISETCKINKNTKRVLVVTKERIRHEGRNPGIN